MLSTIWYVDRGVLAVLPNRSHEVLLMTSVHFKDELARGQRGTCDTAPRHFCVIYCGLLQGDNAEARTEEHQKEAKAENKGKVRHLAFSRSSQPCDYVAVLDNGKTPVGNRSTVCGDADGHPCQLDIHPRLRQEGATTRSSTRSVYG